MGSPNDIQQTGYMVEGVGDAHSTDDNQDNITWKEGRGITIGKVLDNKMTTKLEKRSILKKVQAEICSLTQKKRKDLSMRDRCRLLQLKLYQKAKQESKIIAIVKVRGNCVSMVKRQYLMRPLVYDL